MAMGCGNLGWLQGSGKRFDAVDSSLTHLIPTAARRRTGRSGLAATGRRTGRAAAVGGPERDPIRTGRAGSAATPADPTGWDGWQPGAGRVIPVVPGPVPIPAPAKKLTDMIPADTDSGRVPLKLPP